MKGLPSGYNKDLQEDKEAVFDAEDNLAGALATLVGVIDGLEVLCRAKPRWRPRACCWPPTWPIIWSGRGCRSAQAHEVVGGMVRQLLARGA